MYQLFKPLLFALEPETAHTQTLRQLHRVLKFPLVPKLMEKLWCYDKPQLVTKKMGLTFKNPIGLAAGFDKNGGHVDSMRHLGFGFIEVGTVTPLAQPGNDMPRLFRLPKDAALINRMGFNNDGVDQMVENLKKITSSDLVIGGNIGKNKITPNDQAANDYLTCFVKLFEHVDYFVVNVSSPNTPGLRNLQEKEPLSELLGLIQKENRSRKDPKPLLLKIAPDLNFNQLDDVLTVVHDHHLDGIIATNTTLSRENLQTSASTLEQIGAGGLSGSPLSKRSTEVVQHIRKSTSTDFVIIGVGGIMNVDDALRKLDAGADLLQIYTGLIYRGPSLISQINREISRLRAK